MIINDPDRTNCRLAFFANAAGIPTTKVSCSNSIGTSISRFKYLNPLVNKLSGFLINRLLTGSNIKFPAQLVY